MIMPSDAVELRIDGPVATVLLNRPDYGNALTRAMMSELRQALSDLHLEKRVRAVILTGAGETFCTGRDPAELGDSGDLIADLARYGEEAEEYRDLLVAMLELPKPLIAAVNGPAAAGGAGLVLGCDAVVASGQATFGFPEPRRGSVAGVAGPLLAHRAGAGVAARLLVTATTIAAAEAHRIGLYHELVPPDLLWARAFELGNECAAAAPQAVQLTKRLLYEIVGEQLGTLLTNGAAASATSRTTDSAKEGIAAEREGREPEWP
ncbi:enoyl-CoA hydratase/isomerase family protein [Botrimarina mediterranea]|uniref:2,3-dehydroadipyl-CoA hydratase n=1 Tax=Botrimarina mediterranea TaxID=2528022 RepID=A0A518K4T4_9BACT|nr:enoyl-CoA hydratase-related protein [Botrimarina mediterranea]QDV72804.1 2,3-dehydroadipyl-CoA hydratase [Botrimarina mediterranea]QDV77378.1 2,3-dehydroadipyl-CoA hydratase [Planctomycetes bacterium K2D]